MALDYKKAAQQVVDKLDSLGMDSTVDGKPSHTARLVEEIMKAIIQEIKMDGVVMVTTQVTTQGSPGFHTGTGIGKGYIL